MPEQEPSQLKIWTGRHVELEVTYGPGDIEILNLDVVPDSAADFERGFLGESTPMAQAISGHTAGDTVTYQAGDRVRVRIISVSEALHGKPEDLSARRDEVERKARLDSDTTNLVLFASSFSGKWGDYDPNAVPQEDEEEGEGKEKDAD
jgi:hypothetical protein